MKIDRFRSIKENIVEIGSTSTAVYSKYTGFFSNRSYNIQQLSYLGTLNLQSLITKVKKNLIGPAG